MGFCTQLVLNCLLSEMVTAWTERLSEAPGGVLELGRPLSAKPTYLLLPPQHPQLPAPAHLPSPPSPDEHEDEATLGRPRRYSSSSAAGGHRVSAWLRVGGMCVFGGGGSFQPGEPAAPRCSKDLELHLSLVPMRQDLGEGAAHLQCPLHAPMPCGPRWSRTTWVKCLDKPLSLPTSQARPNCT